MQQISKIKKTELGKIPEDWKIGKLKDVCDILDGKRIPVEESNRNRRHGKYPYYGASGVIDYIDDYIFDERLICLAEDGENLRSRVVPVAFTIEGKTWVNNHAHVLRPRKESLDHFYFNYFLNHIKYDKYLSFTAQPKLNQDNMKGISVILPSVREQQKIASILSKVDKLIQKTDQIIEQTQRLKKGLMRRLLTKGIGHTKFKTTEVGEIPDIWRIMKINELIKDKEGVKTGPFGSTLKKEIFVPHGFKIYGQENVIPDDFTICDYYISEDVFLKMQKY
jgi:type I restriction enzyme S subunit